ncbi:hypothetical protein, partial [Streptomyces hygroscopicus]|uniref:hypothetical protein n=1 Tax=Streptomyces hygroscopicus TaxID=1912 RepID=UPI001C659396
VPPGGAPGAGGSADRPAPGRDDRMAKEDTRAGGDPRILGSTLAESFGVRIRFGPTRTVCAEKPVGRASRSAWGRVRR